MKTYIAQKPYVMVVKDNKVIHKAAVRNGGVIVTDGVVTFFDTEAEWRAAVIAVDPQAFTVRLPAQKK